MTDEQIAGAIPEEQAIADAPATPQPIKFAEFLESVGTEVAADLLAMQLPLAGLFWHKLRELKTTSEMVHRPMRGVLQRIAAADGTAGAGH
jgi:hypothetical protein